MLRAPRPARLDAELPARVQDFVPDALGLLGRDVDFETVLAGVAGARDAGGRAGDFAVGEVVILDRREIGAGQLLQSRWRLGPLNRQLRVTIACKLHFGVSLVQRGDVLEILILIGGVDAEEVVIVGHFVDQDVVDESAVLVQQAGVMRLPDFQLGDGVGGDRSR